MTDGGSGGVGEFLLGIGAGGRAVLGIVAVDTTPADKVFEDPPDFGRFDFGAAIRS